MPIRIIYKFHKNPIKTKKAMLRTGSNMAFLRHSGASNSKVNSPIWPEFELIRDYMTVLVTCKFEDDSIKSEGAILWTTFSPLQVYGKYFVA